MLCFEYFFVVIFVFFSPGLVSLLKTYEFECPFIFRLSSLTYTALHCFVMRMTNNINICFLHDSVKAGLGLELPNTASGAQNL